MRTPTTSLRFLTNAAAVCACVFVCTIHALCARGAEDPAGTTKPKVPAAPEGVKPRTKPTAGLVPLNEAGTVLFDRAGKKVVVKGEVVLRNGGLEMFACRKKSKEHESIVAIDADAFVIHSALLALKAAPGGPAMYEPKFAPPHGQKLDIFVNWTDGEGKNRRERAESWVRETVNRFWVKPLEKLPEGVDLPENSPLKYDRKQHDLLWYGPMTDKQKTEYLAMSKDKTWREAIEFFHERGQLRGLKAEWVFVGSILSVDESTGEKSYAAEEGQYICVSNFSSSMVDVAVQSSDQADNLAYEAWTERIPPKGTAVTLELIPVFEMPPEKPAN
ncbi:MAG: YdjY domain-containing protein [Planctomycetota bacterium]|nr:YdjY domain-containing protein [Planctomycetota bacterium]